MCILQISFEILDQLIGIIFTVRVGRLDGQGAEDVSAESLQVFQFVVEQIVVMAIRDNGGPGAEPGDIEGLAGIDADNAVVGRPFVDVSKRNMSVLFIDDVGMDFIRDDENMVLLTDGSKMQQFIFGKAFAGRIVGTAEQKHGRTWICSQFFEVFPIYGPGSIGFFTQWIRRDKPPVVGDYLMKG